MTNTRAGPGVSGVAFTNQPTGQYAIPGNHIEVTVHFNRAVTVSGTPRIELSPAFGPNGEIRYATYVSGSPGTMLVFRHTLVEEESSGERQRVGGCQHAGRRRRRRQGQHPHHRRRNGRIGGSRGVRLGEADFHGQAANHSGLGLALPDKGRRPGRPQ